MWPLIWVKCDDIVVTKKSYNVLKIEYNSFHKIFGEFPMDLVFLHTGQIKTYG